VRVSVSVVVRVIGSANASVVPNALIIIAPLIPTISSHVIMICHIISFIILFTTLLFINCNGVASSSSSSNSNSDGTIAATVTIPFKRHTYHHKQHKQSHINRHLSSIVNNDGSSDDDVTNESDDTSLRRDDLSNLDFTSLRAPPSSTLSVPSSSSSDDTSSGNGNGEDNKDLVFPLRDHFSVVYMGTLNVGMIFAHCVIALR
jgi:hypothetical protein